MSEEKLKAEIKMLEGVNKFNIGKIATLEGMLRLLLAEKDRANAECTTLRRQIKYLQDELAEEGAGK